MTSIRANASSLRHRSASLLAMLGILALATGCLGGESTVPEGAIYRITADIKDSYPAGTLLSVPIHVTLDGAALVATPVRWFLLGGHGAVSDTLSTTDTLGAAHTLWTLSPTPEDNSLVVVAGGAVDTLHVTGVLGSPSYLDIVGARSDTTTAGAPVTLQVLVRDHSGNAIPGVTVNWSSNGGSVSPSSAVSDATGTSTAKFTAGATGSYQVTADLPGHASLFFEVVIR